MPTKIIWDFVGASGRNVIEQWAMGRLSRRDRAALLQRAIQLGQMDRQTALDIHLIAGRLRGGGNLYKLRAKGDCQLRPHLCTGPVRHGDEYTLLCGAVEKGGKLEPRDAAERAVTNREQLTPERIYERRIEHFSFGRKG